MARVTTGGIIKTSIITAFTIAAALIWKDVITDTIELIVPPGEEIFYKFLAAVLATALVVIAIYIILETQHEAETVIKKIKEKKNKKNKEIVKAQ